MKARITASSQNRKNAVFQATWPSVQIGNSSETNRSANVPGSVENVFSVSVSVARIAGFRMGDGRRGLIGYQSGRISRECGMFSEEREFSPFGAYSTQAVPQGHEGTKEAIGVWNGTDRVAAQLWHRTPI
jgi:hypothetical protein